MDNVRTLETMHTDWMKTTDYKIQTKAVAAKTKTKNQSAIPKNVTL